MRKPLSGYVTKLNMTRSREEISYKYKIYSFRKGDITSFLNRLHLFCTSGMPSVKNYQKRYTILRNPHVHKKAQEHYKIEMFTTTIKTNVHLVLFQLFGFRDIFYKVNKIHHIQFNTKF